MRTYLEVDSTNKRGDEKEEKDDEEEWGRIPIPTSEDSSEDTWGDDLEIADDNEGDDSLPILFVAVCKHQTKTKGNDEKQEDAIAFSIGPRRDGSVRRKDGTIISVNDTTPLPTYNFKQAKQVRIDLPYQAPHTVVTPSPPLPNGNFAYGL